MELLRKREGIMKKNLILALVCMFSFVFIFGACSSDSGSSKKGNGFFRNTIDGKWIDITPVTNRDNTGINDDNLIHLVQGETFLFQAIFLDYDSVDYDDPELVNSIWKTIGNIGYFTTEGNTAAAGNTASFTSGATGATGTISIELNGYRCTYPVKIVASQSDLPYEGF